MDTARGTPAFSIGADLFIPCKSTLTFHLTLHIYPVKSNFITGGKIIHHPIYEVSDRCIIYFLPGRLTVRNKTIDISIEKTRKGRIRFFGLAEMKTGNILRSRCQNDI
jgi:hypothetical protein